MASRLLLRPILLAVSFALAPGLLAAPLAIQNDYLNDYNHLYAPYAEYINAVGGTPPYALTCGGLPAGLSCTPGTTNIEGTVTGGDGVYSVTLTVTDALNATASTTLSLRVYKNPQIATTVLPAGYRGVDFGTMDLIGLGGSAPASWSVTAGALPPGMTLDSAGALTGTPTTVGSYPFTVTYTTAAGGASQPLTMTVVEPTAPNRWVRRGLAGASMGPLWFSPKFALDRTVVALRDDRRRLFVSTDGGLYWRPLAWKPVDLQDASGTHTDRVDSLAFSPDFDGRGASGDRLIAVGSKLSGVWYTDDLGATWWNIANGLGTVAGDPAGARYGAGVALGSDFSATRQLYCRSFSGADERIFRTTLNLPTHSAIWSARSPAGLQVSTFKLSPAFGADARLLASGFDVAAGEFMFWRSGDAGASLQPIADLGNENGVYEEQYDFSPAYASNQVFWYILWGGLHWTSDDGATYHGQPLDYRPYGFYFPPDYHPVTHPWIYGITIAHPTGGRQVSLSTNNGRNFAPTGTGGMPVSETRDIFALYFSPDFVNDRTILSPGTGSTAYFRTEDAGATWAPSDGGLYALPINSLAFAPDYAASRTVFLGTLAGAYRSTDAGATWQAADTGGRARVNGLAVSPAFASDGIVFAATDSDAGGWSVYRSTDRGATYAKRSQNLVWITDVYPRQLQLPADFPTTGRVYMSGTGGLQWSDDGGVYFTDPWGSPTVSAYGLSPGFATDHALYANLWNGTHYVSQADYSYSTVPGALSGVTTPVYPASYNQNSGVNGQLSHTFFMNCGKTTDGGTTFTAIPTAGPGCSSSGTELYISPTFAADSTLYSNVRGTASPGLYRSTNGGSSFAQRIPAADPTAFDDVRIVALSPAHATDGTVMVATGAGLWISRDFGATWSLSTGTNTVDGTVTAVATDPNLIGGLFVGTQQGKVYRSTDDGRTAADLSTGLPGGAIRALLAVGAPTAALAATPTGIYRRTNFTPGGSWALATGGGGDIRSLSTDGTTLFAARTGGASLSSADNGLTWNALSPAISDASHIVRVPGGGSLAENTTAATWVASAAQGAYYSSNSGASWTAANGLADYALPAGGGWSAVMPMGINAASGGREVAIGNSTQGVWLTRDGGDTWRNVSGTGSGLELTSRNVSAFLTAATAYATTDLLVGVNGATTGGVYLSSDGGRHWLQINQGFDPNNLAISSLVKTSCAGCPVQYYSGSYGSGVYTRTIAVNPPPTLTGWCAGAACACAGGALAGPTAGGTSVRLCGTNFRAGMVVEFGGVAAVGCILAGSTAVTCATPVHPAGAVEMTVRNADTRDATAAALFSYGGATGSTRAGNSLRVARAGSDANLTWSCASCTAGDPARAYRARNAAFTDHLEPVPGGALAATDPRAFSTAQSYFWTVE